MVPPTEPSSETCTGLRSVCVGTEMSPSRWVSARCGIAATEDVDGAEAAYSHLAAASITSIRSVCTGISPTISPWFMVSKAMGQINNPRALLGARRRRSRFSFPSWGDLLSWVYQDKNKREPDGKDPATMYELAVLRQFVDYHSPIFRLSRGTMTAIHRVKREVGGFFAFHKISALPKHKSPDDQTTATPAARIQASPTGCSNAVRYRLALYTNDINGGAVDDPMGTDKPQIWLVDT